MKIMMQIVVGDLTGHSVLLLRHLKVFFGVEFTITSYDEAMAEHGECS